VFRPSNDDAYRTVVDKEERRPGQRCRAFRVGCRTDLSACAVHDVPFLVRDAVNLKVSLMLNTFSKLSMWVIIGSALLVLGAAALI